MYLEGEGRVSTQPADVKTRENGRLRVVGEGGDCCPDGVAATVDGLDSSVGDAMVEKEVSFGKKREEGKETHLNAGKSAAAATTTRRVRERMVREIAKEGKEAREGERSGKRENSGRSVELLDGRKDVGDGARKMLTTPPSTA